MHIKAARRHTPLVTATPRAQLLLKTSGPFPAFGDVAGIRPHGNRGKAKFF